MIKSYRVTTYFEDGEIRSCVALGKSSKDIRKELYEEYEYRELFPSSMIIKELNYHTSKFDNWGSFIVLNKLHRTP